MKVDFVGPVCLRTCTKCGEAQVLEEFGKHSLGAFRRQSACRVCRAAKDAAWYAANQGKAAISGAAWRAANKGRKAASDAALRKTNPEKAAAQNKAWHIANPGKAAAQQAAWHIANPGRASANNKARYAADPTKFAAQNKAWRASNPDKMAAKASRRRAAQLRALPPWADVTKITRIFEQARAQKLAVDHIYPLKGKTVSGLHVEANLRPLCPKANSRKQNKLPGFLAHELWGPADLGVYHETLH